MDKNSQVTHTHTHTLIHEYNFLFLHKQAKKSFWKTFLEKIQTTETEQKKQWIQAEEDFIK